MTSLAATLSAALSLIWVDPYGETPFLPDAFPKGGIETNMLSLAAAIGEIETVSFSVLPARDLSKVDFVPSALSGPGGATIPAEAADFALVKVWFRAGDRWVNSWAGKLDSPALINDLVLHDDGLVKVDEEGTNMFLRIDGEDGPRYADIRHKGRDSRFRHDLEQVRDAKRFVPFDLKAGRYQQYWLTWRVPADAKPGLYRGVVAVSEDGRPLGDIPVELEVYPFALPRARTHYDTSKEYMNIWMDIPTLGEFLSGSKRLDVAEAKCRAVYRSLAEHNSHQPDGPGDFADSTTDDLNVRSLLMMRGEGMRCRPIFHGRSSEYTWTAPMEGPVLTPEEAPDKYREALERHHAYVDVQVEVLDKYLGHRDCYFMNADECSTDTHRRSYAFWKYIYEKGCGTWSDYGEPADISAFVDVNDVPAACMHSKARAWHAAGSLCVTYAGTFAGPACPALWRRHKGLRYYYADFDGVHEKGFASTRYNRWNDFVFHGSYAQSGMVYYTCDGLLSTLAWEGIREGMDDVRYLSLLRLRAEAAMKSDDPAIRAQGRSDFLWMDSIDPEAVLDLGAFRREVARRIVALVGKVGPEPPDEPLPMPAPELPPCTYGRDVPAGADRMELARMYEAADRWDLAIPMLEAVRVDVGEEMGRRVDAALAESRLLSGILHRREAVRVVDDTLAWREPTKAQRAHLLLRKIDALLTDAVFEERYTPEQLAAAADVAAEALKAAGATAQERYNCVLRLASAYVASGEYKAAVDYCDARLEDVPMSDPDKAELALVKARAYESLGDFRAACRMYDRAHSQCRNYNDKGWRRRTLLDEARVAEACQDWKRAQRCFADVIDVYGKLEKDLRSIAQANLVRVSKKTTATRPDSIEELDDPPAGTLELGD